MSRGDDRKWASRPILSRLLRVGAFLAPIAVSIVAACIASVTMPQPTSTIGVIGWWIGFIAAITIPMILMSHLVRRLLPLAALLELTLVFPDEAPSRFAVAKAAGRTRELKAKLREATSEGKPNEVAQLVIALITSLGDHDRLTRGHSERVRAFTDMLAEQIGIPATEREKLRWGALLHDIGKLEVTTEILNKEGRPDDEEWEIIRKHPLEGARIIGPLRGWLGEWVGAISHHHEHWDGSGYVLGLKGEQISLGGRILAIADAYEVMTAARPYKKPLAPEAARKELARCAGTHFDPRLVRCFLEISIGRVWRTVGVAALLAQLPILTGLSIRGILQRMGRATATVASATIAVGGLVTSGIVDPPTPHRVPAAVALAAPDAVEASDETSEPGAAGRAPETGSGSDGEAPEASAGASSEADGPSAASPPDAGVSSPESPEGPSGEPPAGDRSDDPPSPQGPYIAQGRISLAGPLNPGLSGATESDFVAACDVPASQGLDAWVFELAPANVGGSPAKVTGISGVGDAALGGRAYDGSCRPLSEFDGPSWSLSSATRFLVVVVPRSVDTRVTLRI